MSSEAQWQHVAAVAAEAVAAERKASARLARSTDKFGRLARGSLCVLYRQTVERHKVLPIEINLMARHCYLSYCAGRSQ